MQNPPANTKPPAVADIKMTGVINQCCRRNPSVSNPM